MSRYVNQTVSTIGEVNAELEKISQSQQDFLTRTGETPNQAEAAVDMNSKQIINLPAPSTQNSPVRLQDLNLTTLPSETNVTTSETFALLETLTPTETGSIFRALDRNNAVYILQDAVYVAITGDITFANGRVGKLQINGVTYPEYYGAARDNTTDDTQAFQDAVDSGHPIELLAGTYRINSKVNMPSTFTSRSIHGAGMGVSNINWQGDTVDGDDLFNFDSTTSGEFFSISDLSINGTHDVNRSNISTYPLLVQRVDEVRIERVEVYYSRVMGIVVRSAEIVDVNNCYVHHCARDGINTAECGESKICDNRIEYIDDDAIAVHNTAFNDYRNQVISGNVIRFSQGIRCLGAHVLSITGNSLDFVFAQGINVQTIFVNGTATEGVCTNFNVNIVGNAISNPVNRIGLDALNTSKAVIFIDGVVAQSGTLSYVPGQNEVGTGTFKYPYDYAQNINSSGENNSNTPVPYPFGIVVANNTIQRNCPTTGMLTDYGFDPFWLRNGTSDLDLSVQANFSEIAFYLLRGCENVIVSGNVVQGIPTFCEISSGRPYKDVLFSDNNFVDGIRVLTATPGTDHLDINFNNCTFDLDTYHKAANRGSNGTWLTVDAVTGFLLQGNTGIKVKNCTFRNMSRLSDIGWDNGVSVGSIRAEDNYYEMEPVHTTAATFNATNRGLGYIPRLGGTLISIDANPNNATYGDITNVPTRKANAIPTSGYFVDGWFVATTNPQQIGTRVSLGWIRTADGTGHVVGTDWEAVWAEIASS